MQEIDVEKPFFRESAVNAFSKRSYGRPIARMPRSWMFSTFLLIAIVCICIWFLATSTYSRKESAVGWLAPTNGLIRITVSQGGLVEKVLVEQGGKVEIGDQLLILSQDKKLVGGKGTSDELLLKLEQKKHEISSQIEIEKLRSQSDISTAKKFIVQLKHEKVEIQNQITQQIGRLQIQEQVYEKFLRLHDDDQTVSYLELQRQKEQLYSQEQSLAALRQRSIALERELISARSTITKRPLDAERLVSEYKDRLIEIANRETEFHTMGGYAIQAPISGSIATLEAQKGNTVYPQQLLASILPANSALYAEIYIPSRAIGFIEQGQEVRVMYAAFPFQRFGAAKGSIIEVSNTVLMPNEIPVSLGLEEPVYKVNVALDKQTMDGFGDILPLRPGMLLRSEIILEKRTFLQWVLEPLRARRSQ